MQNAINLALVQQLRMFRFDGLQFDGHFFARRHVSTQINVTKRPAANFAAQPVLFSDTQLHIVVDGFVLFCFVCYSVLDTVVIIKEWLLWNDPLLYRSSCSRSFAMLLCC